MAALLTMLLSAAIPVSPLPDADLSRSLALSRQIAAKNGIRVIEIPAELGECWGSIASCPDVLLVVTFVTGDLYDPPVAYSLPASKGWVFVGWQSSNTFVLRTSIPDANIEGNERARWRPIEYTVTVSQEGASYSLGAPN